MSAKPHSGTMPQSGAQPFPGGKKSQYRKDSPSTAYVTLFAVRPTRSTRSRASPSPISGTSLPSARSGKEGDFVAAQTLLVTAEVGPLGELGRAHAQRMRAQIAFALWDDEAWFELAAGQVRLARASGTLSWLPFALDYLAENHIQAGQLSAAAALLTEGERIDPGIRAATLPYVSLLLTAGRPQARS